MPSEGLVTLESVHDFTATLRRLEQEIEGRAIKVLARIDHAAGAASLGLPLRPTMLLIFGNPAAGTPLMQAGQTAGVDLPLKTLVWQDERGTTHVTYVDPVWIAERHGAGQAAEATTRLSAAIAAIVRHATGP